MNAIITPSCLNGEISAISSKSVAHRLLICAAFCDKKTLVKCENINKDISATVDCLRSIGAEIDYTDETFSIIPFNNNKKSQYLNCNESGSTLRFLLPIAAALGGDWHFLMKGRLAQRPLSPLKEELEGQESDSSDKIEFRYIYSLNGIEN